MKTKEELNALKKEVETLRGKLAELTEDELAQVSGGFTPPYPPLSISVKPGFVGTFNGNAKTVKTDLGLVSDRPVSAVNETDEQLVKGGNILTSTPSSKTLS